MGFFLKLNTVWVKKSSIKCFILKIDKDKLFSEESVESDYSFFALKIIQAVHQSSNKIWWIIVNKRFLKKNTSITNIIPAPIKKIILTILKSLNKETENARSPRINEIFKVLALIWCIFHK